MHNMRKREKNILLPICNESNNEDKKAKNLLNLFKDF